jgi:uncharacterized protein YecE (DUF72 family)
MPRAHICQNWKERTGEGFCFVVKLNRQITHRHKLLHVEPALEIFLRGIETLEEKLGPILVQLPPHFAPDAQRLENFLAGCPDQRRWAVEFRDPAWLNDEVYEVLKRHQAALVIHDLIPDHPQVVTADWTYYRFHGPQGQGAAGKYTSPMLRAAARRIKPHLKAGRDVYAYFNNDVRGNAVVNALELRRHVAGT